jgi:ABC-type nitrate/sulfonate/bicarbonate transport system substrate-binding protein
MLLRRFGLVPDKDVKILYAGSSPALLTTLKAGNAAAGLMNAPIIFQAQELGFKQILNVTELNIPFIFVGVVTTRKVLQQKPDAISRYLRGYTEAISIILRDKETAMKVMGKFMKTDNRRTLEAVYEEHAPVFQRVPLMTREAVQALLEVAKSPKAAQVKPEDFFDNSFLQKLEASGFIDALYAR